MVGVLIWTAGSGGAREPLTRIWDSATRSDTVESTTKGAGSAARDNRGLACRRLGSDKRRGLHGHRWGSGSVRGAGVGAGAWAGAGVGTGADASGEPRGQGPGRERREEALRIPPETGAPDQRGAAVRPRAGLAAWVPLLSVAWGKPAGPAGERAVWASPRSPARQGLLFRRTGSRPGRDGESASGSTSDSTRHDAYPGLPATPGQGNSHVSRETLPRESNPSAYAAPNPRLPLFLGQFLSRGRLSESPRRPQLTTS